MINFLIIYIIIFLIIILMSIFSSNYTKILGVGIMLPFAIIINIFIRPDNIFIYILQIFISIILFTIYFIILEKKRYDFTRKVLSFRYIINSSILKPRLSSGNNERIIGKVLPYNKYQLKYNGRFITVNEISTAGATMISGSIGSGKTYGIISLIKQNIASGQSVAFVEYKGDPKVILEIEDFAKLHNYNIFNLSGGKANFNYDPLENINNVGRIEAIINMRKWSLDGSDAHYRTSVQLLLQKLVGEFGHLYNYSENKSSYTIEFYNFVKKYNPDRTEWDSYSTTSKLLELLITSSLEPMFRGENNKTLSFDEIKNDKFIVIVSFISSNKELATSFSSLMFKDLLDQFTIDLPDKNLNLYIDEFGTLENPFIIKDILEKGRSAKIATTLALQDINQIIIQTNQAYLDSILGIINTFIIYSGATRNTAEKFAGVQLAEIEAVLMNLRKPINGKTPTAIYISKYPTLNKRITSEVFRFEPYIYQKHISSFNFESISTLFYKKENEEIKKENDINIVDIKNNINDFKVENKEISNKNKKIIPNIEENKKIIKDIEKFDYDEFI